MAILDPETGERKWFHNGLISAADIKIQFGTFLQENPIQIEAGGGKKRNGAPAKDLDSMTEDEQMAWVMQQSMNEEGGEDGDEPYTRPPKRTASTAGEKARRSRATKRGSAISAHDSEDEDSDFDSRDSEGSTFEAINIEDDDEPEVRERPKRRAASKAVVNLDDDSDSDEELIPRPKRVKMTPAKVTAPISPPKPEPVPEPEPEPEEEYEDEPNPEGEPDCTLQVRFSLKQFTFLFQAPLLTLNAFVCSFAFLEAEAW